jgi:hypothetical protein
VDDTAESLAVNLRTYVPDVEKVAVVLNAWESPKVTVPGPLTFDQVFVNVFVGKPSSLAVPDRFAEAGSVMVWFEPALTVGGLLEMMVTSEVDESNESLAVSRNT